MRVNFSPPILVRLRLPELDEYQRPAVENRGPTLVKACPGSGKTATLCSKIKQLLGEGVSPASILPLTFSNRAAREMEQVCPQIKAFTFHSLAYQFSGRGANVITPEEQVELIQQLLGCSEWQAREVVTLIGKAKSEMRPLEGWIGRAYERELKRSGRYDFNDMLNFFLRDLENKDFQSRLKRQFRYLLVDEFQDTSTQQYEILLKLSDENIFVVGDPNQSIYSWRQATPENFNRLEKDFKPKVFFLLRNYRSGKSIVDFAELIYPVGMRPNEALDSSVEVRLVDREADFILKHLPLPGVTYVIARTREQLRDISAKLKKTPHRIRTDAEGRVERSVGSPPYIELLTAHAAKGGEADNVFLVGAEVHLFPHALSDSIVEERNLFYVACSRPRHKLFITYRDLPTPFLRGWFEKCGEYHQY